MPRRLFVISLCTIAGVALAGPAAQASAPYVTHYKDLPAVYTDDSLCHFGPYAFDVTVNGSDQVTIREYDIRIVFVDKFRGIVTGPTGKQLVKTEDAVITEDFATGNQTWNGVAEGYAFPDGKNLARDNGQIVFDQDGNTISENGPHPIADGPGRVAVCEALKP